MLDAKQEELPLARGNDHSHVNCASGLSGADIWQKWVTLEDLLPCFKMKRIINNL